jgi:glycosyltransferase involved in cell wall biosynthesis
MKLACVGPLSPLRTGVAHFSENLLPFLAEYCEVTLFTDAYPPSPTPILKRFQTSHISELTSKRSSFDIALYHMGNHYGYHRSVFDALCRLPGLVILHDCVLNQFFAKYALERGNFHVFKNLLKLCYPDITNAEVAEFFKAEADPYRFPLAGVVARAACGVIVLNEYARAIVLNEAPASNILKIAHPYFPSAEGAESVQSLRKKLGLSDGCFVVASVGHMTPAKRIDVAIEAFEKFKDECPESVFLLAGQVSGLPLDRMIRRSSSDKIRYLGYLGDSEFSQLMQLGDVFVNLRYPSSGEMSGTLLHMLGRGKVVVVSNYAQFAEFPDGMCVKVDLGPDEVDDLAGQLLRLARDPERRAGIGDAARRYIAQNHTRDAAAKDIVRFAETILESGAEPTMSAADVETLLRPDAFPNRIRQSIAYQTRRLLQHCRRYGMVPTLRSAVKKSFTER